MKRLLEFLESRAGASSLWRAFADEAVPVRRAWLFTLGSALLFALVVQAVTGLALALSYAPTPDHAWESVKAIQTKLPAGAVVRGLHHWGASAMVVLAALHLARTFLFASYRKPRELNWLVGVALLLLILAFGFTGYLLPWDQKAYWATVVGTKVPSALPVVGPAVSRVMAGGSRVGAATLTRFYAVHVVLLPLLTLGLVAAHLLLLRKHGHAGPTSTPDPRQPFFPYQAARDAVVGLAVVLLLFALASGSPAPLERVADPADTAYVPRPEWYFLPLFQLLKFFKGPLEPLGTAVLPGISMLLLALVPWLDRGASRSPRDRKPVLAAGALAGAGILALLVFGALDAPKTRPASGLGAGDVPDPRLLGGLASYTVRGCASCHGVEGVLAANAPGGSVPLAARSLALSGDALVAHVKEKTPKPAASAGEGGEDPDKDVPSLVEYVGALKEGASFAALPAPIRAGGAAIDREDCRQCHQIYGDGGRKGPPLQHLTRKARQGLARRALQGPEKARSRLEDAEVRVPLRRGACRDGRLPPRAAVTPTNVRIALANVRYPATPEESVVLAERAIAEAGAAGAAAVCFPECYVPGYRGLGKSPPPPDPGFLEKAWTRVAAAAATARIAVVLGTERVEGPALLATALVIGPDGARLGFQDKVQLDPSEDATYARGSSRRVFTVGPLTFGVVICHEGWRYPETVRWAARHGAQVVFHPHLELGGPDAYAPATFADPKNTFHEKALLCRAAENTVWIASVNYAAAGSATTSAVVKPDGTLLAFQPYGREGLLVADLDLSLATGLLAKRLRPA